jgi:geranylgeranyl diphosphate synthase type II
MALASVTDFPPPPLTPSVVPETLKEYGELTRNALERYLSLRETRPYLGELVADYPLRPGKGLRPSLCIATARAFGAPLEQAMHSAISIELLHNALLIHDDIEDGSAERRGDKTLHELHGVPLAINAGDALTLLSLRPLLENVETLGPELSFRLIQETEQMAQETAEGQALDIGWRRDNAVDVDASGYLEMVLKKTCWFGTIYPCRLGALIGTQGRIADAQLEPFIRFGFFLGAAFQIQDDVLNLVGDGALYGKELAGDLFEGKRTLMLVRLLELATANERARVTDALTAPREQRVAADVEWMLALMHRYGCIEYARQVAVGLAGAALREYQVAYGALPDGRDRRFIEGLATWVFERQK